MEEWKTIPGFENYQVSNLGRIKGKTNKILSCASDKDGYLYFNAYNGSSKTRKTLKVHRCVGLAFLENPNNKPTIDHINRNRSDNRCENLRWASREEQSRNTKDPENQTGQKYIRFNHGSYYCYYDKNNTIRFDTLEEAIEYRGKVLNQNIADVLQDNDNHKEY